ncbi:hypothetical protein Ngar_c03560 [Candidatus Nitrososphaera gargensis Ga9.2]|uniref:Zona occludens toxin N-terminal domain-containing protein n=1 Tax=Nitrososphaera gargensis (strain Ga9.2) TaxID=1237085 RepID=K0ILS9_NITGG|nr:hypothetical protein [Candidatus Nitrososphaera gargensis]AFU57275.1 hypothetical protein Ngar_c03270 [Candidatus Nitrososphaera gargensis Ga9.2]AFU57304.1 hypothetical protein Ngar_c03560 [Candidatus Nitrososphaera gargensis Ga9.2]
MTYRINFCQGELSEHVAIIGDGKVGKTSFARDHLLRKLPGTFKKWCYDYNHNGFIGIGPPVRSLDALIDANMQYLPQEKSKEELNGFLEVALRLGNRVVAIDEFHAQQNSKSIPKPTQVFLKTFRHVSGSWIVIAQSPLELHDDVYHNADHIFAFFMKPTSRHTAWYYEKFGQPMTFKLMELHYEAVQLKAKRPYIYTGASSIEAVIYSHKGKFVQRFDAKGKPIIVQLKGAKA